MMMTTIFLYRFNIAIQRLTDENIRNIGIDKLLFIFYCFDKDDTRQRLRPCLFGG